MKIQLLLVPFTSIAFLTNCNFSKYFEVNFQTDGGTTIAPIRVKEREKLDESKIPIPRKLRYNFNNWYVDKWLTTLYDFSLPVVSDLTLYAKYNVQPPAATMKVIVTENNTISFACSDTDVFSVNWGDGTIDDKRSHTYLDTDFYTINISGKLSCFACDSDCKEALTGFDFFNVNSIADDAFNGCIYLRNIKIPNNVISIGKNAFKNCRDMESFTFMEPSQLKSIGFKTFVGCKALKDIGIPSTITSIDDFAFSGCELLENVWFGANSQLKTIGDGAFQGCNLKSLIIPSSVTSIGYAAFYGSQDLDFVNLMSFSTVDSIPTLGLDAFVGCPNIKFHVDNEEIKNNIVLKDGWKQYSPDCFVVGY